MPTGAADPRRAAVRLSAFSVAWTVITSCLSLGAGLLQHSLVVVVFGAVGLLDAAGSAALVVHFRHLMRHDSVSDRHERRAFFTINVGLVVVGVVTIAASGARLLGAHHHPDRALFGAVNAVVAGAVLAVLARRKLRLGRILADRALLADGHLSTTGAALAAITVTGAVASSGLGWWWVDPTAAGAVAVVAALSGLSSLRDAA